MCVRLCECVLKLQVNRFPLTLPDTAVERKSEDNRWSRVSDPSSTPYLCPPGEGGEVMNYRFPGSVGEAGEFR